MPQSLACMPIHLVFSTKNRAAFIGKKSRKEMFSYLAGTLKKIDCPSILVGGMPDHVHLLFLLARTMALSDVVEEIKKESSKWAKQHVAPDFYWQNGYGAFAVSSSMVTRVKTYIENQEEHHRTRTFQDEYRELLKRHKLEWDEKYVWD